MHLKFDAPILRKAFYTGLILALCVYLVASEHVPLSGADPDASTRGGYRRRSMIDIRRLRTDPRRSRRPRWRVGRSISRDDRPRPSSSTGGSREPVAERDEVRSRVERAVQAGRRARARPATSPEPRRCRPRAARSASASSELEPSGRRRRRPSCATAPVDIPNLPVRRRARRRRRADNAGRPGRRLRPRRATAPHQRVPHWDIGTELGILDIERAREDLGVDVHDAARRSGATLSRALVPARARPQRRRLRGDPPADPGRSPPR